MKPCFVFLSESDVKQFLAIGYPKSGKDIGGGRHVPPEGSQTLAASLALKNLSTGEFIVEDSAHLMSRPKDGLVEYDIEPLKLTCKWPN